MAAEFGGLCNLRFDDTNPSKEDVEYVDSIKEDVRWLGFDWDDREFYASDYFEQLYEFALQLIKAGKAFVCDLTADQMREYRGTLTEPGKNSPYRDRSVEENLDLFRTHARGRICRRQPDATRENRHGVTEYQYAGPGHVPQSCARRITAPATNGAFIRRMILPMVSRIRIEGITHSICTLEFEDHRPLYDWFLDQLGIHHPQQIEFARLNLTYTVLSKRKLLQLVQQNMSPVGTIRGCQR